MRKEILNETLNLANIVVNPPEESVTEDRERFLGGSDIAKVTSKRGLYNLFKEKQKKKTFKTEYTELGHTMESSTKDFIKEHLRENILSASYVDEGKSVRVNVDGLMRDGDKLEVIEMKNNTLKTSYANIGHYIRQVHLYMYMLNTDKCRLIETERIKNADGTYKTDVDLDMITVSVIPRNEDIIEDILWYIEDFRYLIEHPDISYNEFMNISEDKIKGYQEVVRDFIPVYKRYKELKYQEGQIKTKIKELVTEDSELANGSIKISVRKNKPKVNLMNIYRDYKQEYIDYITKVEDITYRVTKTLDVKIDKVGYEEFNNVEDLLVRLGHIEKEIKEIELEHDIKDRETYIKELLYEEFKEGVDLGELEFKVTRVKNSLDSSELVEYIESRGKDIELDNYTEESEPSKVYKIKANAPINKDGLINAEI